MKKICFFLGLFCLTLTGYSQVGINTTMPNAQLDIKSSNQITPANTDGILIPKVDAFPVTNPTAAQNSMLVYLTTVSGGKQPGFYYWDNATISWKGIDGDKGWSLTGNAGTDDSINFIGTTDFMPLRFRVINENAGKIDGNGNGSVFFGYKSGQNDGLYNDNVAFGNLSLFTNTSGQENVAIGGSAMYFNQSGSNNMAVGRSALKANTTGSANAAIGSNSLFSNQTGFSNTANGGFSLYSNITGNENTTIGKNAMYAGSAGNNNVAVGFESLKITNADNNTAIGYKSGINNTGANNIMLGANSAAPSATASNQLSIGNVIYGTTMSTTALGKIGIGEPAPAAKLQISSATPATPVNTDGIIIPRVSTLTAAGSMTAAQNGMMVFLTTPTSQSGFYYWDNPSTSWKGAGANTANAWSLTGNTGYNASTSFIGSIDSKEVFFRHTNQPSGVIGVASTAFGYRSGGTYNIAAKNTSVGSLAAESNTVGLDNSAFGSEALNKNTSASKNVAVGNLALTKQSFSNGGTSFDTLNTAIGYSALTNLNGATTAQGIANVGIGAYALTNNVTGSSNVAVGYSALGANWLGTPFPMTGNQNVAIGSAAIKSNVTGSANIALGGESLGYNTVGDGNISIGLNALYYSGGASGGTAIGTRAMQYYNFNYTPRINDNVALGYEALRGLSCCNTYDQNTAIGYQSMTSNTLASNNAALGYKSLYNNKNAGKNIAIGSSALYTQNFANGNVAFDTENIAIGFEAMYSNNPTSNTNGRQNVAVGNYALRGNANGQNNTALGYQTLNANSTGSGNISIGSTALLINTSGSSNTAVGTESLYNNVSGTNNTALGYDAGYNSTGFQNTFLGASSFPTTTGYNNYTGIGYYVGSGLAANNVVELGNTSVVAIRGQVTGITAYSDKRIKNNIKSDVPGLSFISKLNPVTYNLDIHKQNEILYRNKIVKMEEWEGKYDIEKITQTGFLAQEVAEAAQAANYDFNGVDVPKNPEDLYSVNYTSFVVPLVKAVQEQQLIIETEKQKNAQLAQELATVKANQQILEARVKAIEEKFGK